MELTFSRGALASYSHRPDTLYNKITHASTRAQHSAKYNIPSMKTYSKPSEMNDIYSWKHDGEGKKTPKDTWEKNKI